MKIKSCIVFLGIVLIVLCGVNSQRRFLNPHIEIQNFQIGNTENIIVDNQLNGLTQTENTNQVSNIAESNKPAPFSGNLLDSNLLGPESPQESPQESHPESFPESLPDNLAENEAQRLEEERIRISEEERLAVQRAEEERLATAQRLEAERQENERLSQEFLEQERLKQEELANEERLRQEALENENLLKKQAEEAAALEAERLSNEKLEQEKVALEQAESARLEAERLEKEKQDKLLAEIALEREAEAARLESERLEGFLKEQALSLELENMRKAEEERLAKIQEEINEQERLRLEKLHEEEAAAQRAILERLNQEKEAALLEEAKAASVPMVNVYKDFSSEIPYIDFYSIQELLSFTTNELPDYKHLLNQILSLDISFGEEFTISSDDLETVKSNLRLIAVELKSLKKISIKGAKLDTSQGSLIISEFLSVISSLEEVALTENGLNDRQLGAFLPLLSQENRIISWDYSRNRLTDSGFISILNSNTKNAKLNVNFNIIRISNSKLIEQMKILNQAQKLVNIIYEINPIENMNFLQSKTEHDYSDYNNDHPKEIFNEITHVEDYELMTNKKEHEDNGFDKIINTLIHDLSSEVPMIEISNEHTSARFISFFQEQENKAELEKARIFSISLRSDFTFSGSDSEKMLFSMLSQSLKKLISLRITGGTFNVSGLALVQTFISSLKLKNIYFEKMSLTDTNSLVDIVNSSPISVLRVSGMNLNENFCEKLAHTIEAGYFGLLKKISLNNNNLEDSCISALGNVIAKNRRILTWEFKNNKITNTGFAKVAGIYHISPIANKLLVVLSGNEINTNEEEMKKIIEGLRERASSLVIN